MAIGDPHGATRRGGEDDLHGGGIHVLAIDDRADEEPLIGHHRTGHPGLPMAERALGVEDVGGHGRPGVRSGPDLLRGGVGVPDGHDDSLAHQPPDGTERVVALGCEGDGEQRLLRRRMPEEHFECLIRRVEHALGPVCALARLGDERPLEMHAQDPARRLAVRRISGYLRPAESLVELIKGRGDDGRLQTGDPTGGPSGEHLLPLLGRGIGEVSAEGPVVLQVHQPRCQHAGPEVDVGGSVVGDGRYPITVDRQRAGSDQAAVLEHLGASDRGHGPSTPLLSGSVDRPYRRAPR